MTTYKSVAHPGFVAIDQVVGALCKDGQDRPEVDGGLSGRFLDYLAALARDLTTKPERDVRQAAAAAPIWPDQVPRHHGVALGPGEDRPAWLVVRKVPEPPAPRLPAALVDEGDPSSLENFVDGPRLRSPEPAAALEPLSDAQGLDGRRSLPGGGGAWSTRIPGALEDRRTRLARPL
jgi:hypothetical protein